MCTASWWFSPDGGYELFFNRDEQKSRARGEPPALRRGEDVRFLAPHDPKHGGTWLAVNELGLACCLINHYPGGPLPSPSSSSPAGRLSRGQLVLRCIGAADTAAVTARLDAATLAAFAPFHLLALAPDGDARLLTWDGANLHHAAAHDVVAPVTSSSFDTRAAIAARHAAYASLTAGLAPNARPPLAQFHDQHDHTRGAHSVFMNRPDACTVSQTRIVVGPGEIAVDYRAIDWTGPAGSLPPEVSAQPARPAQSIHRAQPGPFVQTILSRRDRARAAVV